MSEIFDGAVRLPTASAGRVLLVDDEVPILTVYGRSLRKAGFAVESARSVGEATDKLARGMFDVVLTDIGLPGSSGIDLLRLVKAHDPDLPVLLMTGEADVPSAIEAVAHGALRYLLKPVFPVDLCETVQEAMAVRRAALRKRQVYGAVADAENQREELSARLDRAIRGLYMVWQPIVCWSSQTLFAYESLVGPSEPLLARPDDLLHAAESLGRIHELGRHIRGEVARTIATSEREGRYFVNLHPLELGDEEVSDPASPLCAVAERVVLEITERASLGSERDVHARLGQFKDLGFRVAVDDLGAGYAGLYSLVQLHPSFVKLDMWLVRGIHEDPVKQKVVTSLIKLCAELGMAVVAEGVETAAERDALVASGCDLLQGYLFARPGPAFVAPAFS
jgi:EAL domain-containing protein (putative c-di-GMP-specific phosphodiesterase class I)